MFLNISSWRIRLTSDWLPHRSRRLASADFAEEVEDEEDDLASSFDFAEEVEDEEAEDVSPKRKPGSSTTPRRARTAGPKRRARQTPAPKGDASALETKGSLASRLGAL